MATERKSNRQIAFLFDEVGKRGLTEVEIGGKAAGLVEMTSLGMPVPSGFVLTSGLFRAWRQEDMRFPRRADGQVRRAIAELEWRTGRRFGDAKNPLLVSVRSGARVSMPGMMDTILNLGYTSLMEPAIAKLGGKKFADDLRERFYTCFHKITGSNAPIDPWEQLELAIEAICHSWYNNAAVAYRKAHSIPDFEGTAITVQAMVFGNIDENSGTGVLFTRNIQTGEREPYGEYLPRAQGDDVVGGGKTPNPISAFAQHHPNLFKELIGWAERLEFRHREVMEIEFTVERRQLWLLQRRRAKRSPVAHARFLVQMQKDGWITKEEAVRRMDEANAAKLERLEFNPEALKTQIPVGRGIAASPGAAVGYVAHSLADAEILVNMGKNVILVRPDTSTKDFPAMLLASGIVTQNGGLTCHAAVTATGLGIPAVVSLKTGFLELHAQSLVSVDGTHGVVYLDAMPFAYAATLHPEAQVFQKWWRKSQPRRKLKLDLVENRFSANKILNDVYLASALAQEAADTSLETEAVRLRNRLYREAAEAFVAYLLLAVAGEAQYGFENDDHSRPLTEHFSVLRDSFGLMPNVDFHKNAHRLVLDRFRNAPIGDVITFLDLIIYGFQEGWEEPTNIGGEKWAEIAKTVHGYLSGALNDIKFVDRVFNLRHNGDRLFDKHPMFSQDTRGEGRYGMLQRQLDAKHHGGDSVQKLVDGLMGAYSATTLFVYRDRFFSEFVSPEVKDLINRLRVIRGETQTAVLHEGVQREEPDVKPCSDSGGGKW